MLVVENLAKSATHYEAFEIVHALVALGFADIAIAFVDLRTEELAMMQYAEFLAHEVGIRGRVFATIEQAHEWITGLDEPARAGWRRRRHVPRLAAIAFAVS